MPAGCAVVGVAMFPLSSLLAERSYVALGGLLVARREGLVDADERVVLLVTGSGLKDVPAVGQTLGRLEALLPTLEALAERLGG